jgi:superfamily II DNA or RNA helicase
MSGSPDLRDYQADLVEEFHSRVAAGDRRILAVMPTGAGKTIVASNIIRTATRNRQRVLVLAH